MEGIGQEQIGNQEHLVEKETINSGEQPEWERADLQVSDIQMSKAAPSDLKGQYTGNFS